MPAHRACSDLVLGGRVLKSGSHVWRVGHVAGPYDYPPATYLPDPRSGRFDDPLKEYRTLYCARHQSVALRESLQEFRHSSETLSKLKAVYGASGVPRAKVPADWRAAHVLAPARIRLAPGTELVGYEDPGLLRQPYARRTGLSRSCSDGSSTTRATPVSFSSWVFHRVAPASRSSRAGRGSHPEVLCDRSRSRCQRCESCAWSLASRIRRRRSVTR